jgi:hypothetical protein
MIKQETFCTISTASHLNKCFALAKSLESFGANLHILLVDNSTYEEEKPSNTHFSFISELRSDIAQKIIAKYKTSPDKLRWSLKPVFLLQLLESFEKVIYVDNDIHFFSSFDFLFEMLEEASVLLTPHDYLRDPKTKQNWLEANFRVGLFNAGFVGVNRQAANALLWWAEACHYRCEKNYWRGLFDDQKYLDLFPVIDEKCQIIRHPGCNVSAWNNVIRKRHYENGKHLVSGDYPVVFYHFNQFAINELAGDDPIWKDYIQALESVGTEKANLPKKSQMSLLDRLKLTIWNFLNHINS